MEYTQEEIEEAINDEIELEFCPACGRDDFKSNKGVAQHHAKKHGFSISMLYRCEKCGKIKSGNEGGQKYCSECNWNSETASYDCPYEGCERSFDTQNGRSVHHSQVHGESIAGYTYECEYCGDRFESPIAPESDNAPKYCPVKDIEGKSCEAKDRTGQSREFTDEWRENISKGMVKAHEEGRAESPFNRGSEWVKENVIEPRDDDYLHESLPEEVKEKVSISLKESYRNGERKPASPNRIIVEETGHNVDSGWEAKVDILLHENGFDYKYNTDKDFPTFQIDGNTYTPDFVIGDRVIEVKGSLGYHYRKDRVEKYAEEMTQRDDVEYIVIGSVDLDCDKYISWEEREQIIDYL